MLFGLGAKTKLINVVDDVPKIIAAVYPVLDLAEYLANLVFNGIRTIGFLLETVQVGKEPKIDKLSKIVTGQRGVVI